MGLENTNTIAGLDASWPLPTDPTNEGNLHIGRVLKATLKHIFPGEGGQGFSEPIVATETELNYVSGVESPIQAQIEELKTGIGGFEGVLTAPTGTIMLFFNESAPEGWAIHPWIANRLIRVVSSVSYANDGGVGGTHDPVYKAHAHSTQKHAISVNEMPQHTHAISGDVGDGQVFGSGTGGGSVNGGQFDMGHAAWTGANQGHDHGLTSITSWSPFYVDAIACIKE